jgi:hypothetical protein
MSSISSSKRRKVNDLSLINFNAHPIHHPTNDNHNHATSNGNNAAKHMQTDGEKIKLLSKRSLSKRGLFASAADEVKEPLIPPSCMPINVLEASHHIISRQLLPIPILAHIMESNYSPIVNSPTKLAKSTAVPSAVINRLQNPRYRRYIYYNSFLSELYSQSFPNFQFSNNLSEILGQNSEVRTEFGFFRSKNSLKLEKSKKSKAKQPRRLSRKYFAEQRASVELILNKYRLNQRNNAAFNSLDNRIAPNSVVLAVHPQFSELCYGIILSYKQQNVDTIKQNNIGYHIYCVQFYPLELGLYDVQDNHIIPQGNNEEIVRFYATKLKPINLGGDNAGSTSSTNNIAIVTELLLLLDKKDHLLKKINQFHAIINSVNSLKQSNSSTAITGYASPTQLQQFLATYSTLLTELHHISAVLSQSLTNYRNIQLNHKLQKLSGASIQQNNIAQSTLLLQQLEHRMNRSHFSPNLAAQNADTSNNSETSALSGRKRKNNELIESATELGYYSVQNLTALGLQTALTTEEFDIITNNSVIPRALGDISNEDALKFIEAVMKLAVKLLSHQLSAMKRENQLPNDSNISRPHSSTNIKFLMLLSLACIICINAATHEKSAQKSEIHQEFSQEKPDFAWIPLDSVQFFVSLLGAATGKESHNIGRDSSQGEEEGNEQDMINSIRNNVLRIITLSTINT